MRRDADAWLDIGHGQSETAPSVPDVLATLDSLRAQRWYSGQIGHIEPLPARSAVYAAPDPALPETIRRHLARTGISGLYEHQVELLRHAREGTNVIITTGAASGKTLAFNLPVLERMLSDRSATALYLYPMKAVTQSQLKVLRDLESGLGFSLNPAVYDGDTPQDKRPQIRKRSRIVLSNPYELHQILPYHYQWTGFLHNLRFCIIDEAHQYRGVFGSNVAQVLRRLRRILKLHGADPQFILSSASVANPQELAGKLTGRDFVHIGKDGSPHGQGWLVFWSPLRDPGTSIHVQTQQLVTHFARAGLQTVCFVPSRGLAELISQWITQTSPGIAVSPYRAGYVAEDRRRIEADLSSGALRAVVSTSALELGIDIGGLDCVVIAGYPGTLASFWQQAGRAGRKLQGSLVVFVGFPGGLDQYLLRAPEIILDRRFESAIIDTDNPYILSGHLACAASESPLQESEVAPGQVPLVKALEDKLVLRRTPVGWIYAGRSRPQEEVTLEAIKERSIEVVAAGRVIETLDLARACRTAHPGAVLLHQGETYLVRSLDLEKRIAEAETQAVDYYTQPIQREELKLLDRRSERPVAPGCTLGIGSVRVTERVTGFRVKRFDQLLSTHPLNLPPFEFPTIGIWIQFTTAIAREVERRGRDFYGGMHGVEHALIDLAPLLAMCDPRDIGGVTCRLFPDAHLPAILVYDSYEHGIGISEKLYAEFDRLCRLACDLVARCGCDEGCPACVLSPRCGDGNQPMDKAAALLILRRLVQPAA
jgi:DEAD/DEAH box helicase domain-containing protein